jgi:hypothetical protein
MTVANRIDIQENFDNRVKKAQIAFPLRHFYPLRLSNSMDKSSQIAWKIAPLIHFFPLKVVPQIEVLLHLKSSGR